MSSILQQIYENNRQAEEIIEQLDTIFYNSSINNISLETSLKLARLDLQLMQTVENRIMRSGLDETQISLYSHSSESFAENVNNFIEYYQDYSGTEYDRGLDFDTNDFDLWRPEETFLCTCCGMAYVTRSTESCPACGFGIADFFRRHPNL